MSMTLSSLHSTTPIKPFNPYLLPRIQQNNHSFRLSSSVLTTKAKPAYKIKITPNFYGTLKINFDGFPLKSSGFVRRAENENGSTRYGDKEEMEARGRSSMPERFRYLAKEAPDKPVRWPWLIVLAFLLYAWRAVLWELTNWRRALGATFQFLGYILKLALALVFHFIGDPITNSIRAVETAFYTIRAFYSSILAYAPIPELTVIIILTSAILSIAEATVPDSVNSQPYLLTVAGFIGFAAVRNYISELFFWTLLVGLFAFARLVKKRDYVSSALPVGTVLAAVGEPWVRVIAIASYTSLAVFHHSKNSSNPKDDEDARTISRVPFPLLCAALAIGIRVAAKWAGYRHLTWMVV